MTDHESRRILSYLQDRRQDMVDLLQRLALAESPSDNPAAVAQVLAMLTSELEQGGLSVRRFPGRGSAGTLFARPRERREPSRLQLLVGHCDTVWPIGTVRQMPVGVEGDIFRGPGVFDMKGGLVQMLYALRAVKDLGLRPPADIVVVINSDEEIGSPDSTPLIRRLARRAIRAFILEPAFGRTGKLKTARKASGSFTITIKGRAAHAGINPEEGASAILEMSHQIQRLFALNNAAQGITVNVGTVDGGLRSNVVAAEVRATVDVRVRTRQDAVEVAAAIRGLRPVNPETTIQVEGGIEQPPMEPLPRNQALWRLARDLGRRLGLELDEAAVGGASDGNTTSQYTATLDGLGAVGDGAHATHEHALISQLVERCALLVLLLLAPLSGGSQDAAEHRQAGVVLSEEQP
jgi:glutamate carboxypeptidase